jgi:hypothetical protein
MILVSFKIDVHDTYYHLLQCELYVRLTLSKSSLSVRMVLCGIMAAMHAMKAIRTRRQGTVQVTEGQSLSPPPQPSCLQYVRVLLN